MYMKKCSKCTIEKNVEYFFKNSRMEDGYNNICKECRKTVNKKYYDKNIENIKKYRESKKDITKLYLKDYYVNNLENRKEYNDKNKEILLIKRKEYYNKNREILIEKSRQRNSQNKEKRSEYNKNYRKDNIEKEVKRWKEYYGKNKKDLITKSVKRTLNKRKQSPIERLKHNVRNRTIEIFKHFYTEKKDKTFDIVGCSPLELKIHLEQKFTEGMSWDNQGKWHIDHIIPLSSATNEDGLYKLCYFTNLQPMWAADNIKKGAKII